MAAFAVYKRAAALAPDEGLKYIGDSELLEPLQAAIDAEYRFNGCAVAVDEVYAVLNEEDAVLHLVKITAAPAGEAV